MQTIAWDVDDVLNDLMRAWFTREWLPGHPECRVTYAGLVHNPPHRELGVPLEEYLASLDRFRLEHTAGLEPTADVLAWFEEHGDEHRHLALTATPLLSSSLSAAWVMRHYGRWIRTIAFVPSPRPDDRSQRPHASKGEYLRWLGRATVFVDDSPGNFEGVDVASTVLFPRPWNDERASIREVLSRIRQRPEVPLATAPASR